MARENTTAILAAVLATEPCADKNAYRAASDAAELEKLGRKLSRIAVDQCNRPWTQADYDRADKVRERVRTKATDILSKYGAQVASVNNDPRGFGLTFNLASQRSNSFGGDVWGVGV